MARFAPDLRVLVHDGASRESSGAHFVEHDVVVTTYGLLRRDADALAGIDFDYVVLDEAHAIKTARSTAAKAARGLRACHRLALTGTPLENRLGELGSLFEFLNPGMLSASSALSGIASGARNVDEDTLALVARAMRPLFLRRTKGEVARELPERIEQTIVCELDRDERRLYDELRDHYRASIARCVERVGWAKSTVHALEALLRLRQAACHPGLVDRDRRDDPSAKVNLLVSKLQSLRDEGRQALVFSQFTSLLSIVRDRLDVEGVSYEYLDGRRATGPLASSASRAIRRARPFS
jgi:SNF2 family DNA or RNA helicase